MQSGKLSTGITEINIKAIDKVIPNTKFNIVKVDHMVRKIACFFVCLFIFGVFVKNALRRKEVCGYRCVVFALLICILYAASDELHQVFVPGRGAQVKDVISDRAAVGIVVNLIKNRINTG